MGRTGLLLAAVVRAPEGEVAASEAGGARRQSQKAMQLVLEYGQQAVMEQTQHQVQEANRKLEEAQHHMREVWSWMADAHGWEA